MADDTQQSAAAEKLGYTRYYEYDGALRAYANRAMLASLLSALVALAMTGLFVYQRLQPPLVIQLSEDGRATVVGGRAQGRDPLQTVALSDGAVAPSDVEINYVLKTFLQHYLEHNPSNIERNLSTALNYMTDNLRQAALIELRESGMIEDIKDKNIITDVEITSLVPAAGVQLAFTVMTRKEVRQIVDGVETTNRIVGSHYVRLVQTVRTADNPQGLFVAEYRETPYFGEQDHDLLQQSEIGNP